jgi:inorganic phosphate transporter, PiT family
MANTIIPVVIIFLLALCLSVVNGFNDSANAIATVIGTRVLSPRTAIIMAALLNFLGAISGIAVAKTIGKGILAPDAISYEVAISALISIVLWGIIATYRGLPISLTHGFVAGLAGAGIALYGTGAVVWPVMVPIVVAVVVAPLLGFIGGFIVMVAIYWIFRRSLPIKIESTFKKLQILSAAFMAYTHGLNDGQNATAVIIMALVIYTGDSEIWNNIPLSIIALSAFAMGIGTATGGWQVIKTLGMKVSTLRPVNGFAAETAAAAVVELGSVFGIPISTTHCISASIIGVGATNRLSAVRWGVAGNIIAAWILTFPLCGGLSFAIAWILKLVFK